MANGRPWAAYNESPLTGRVKGGFILANYTEHYGLHQWVPEDDFLRTDFNTDFALIDAALAGLAAADSAQTSALAAAKTELQGSITSGDNNLSLALASAKTALQNAITSGDNAQAAALSQAQAALQSSIAAESTARSQGDAVLSASKLELVCGSFVGTAGDGTTTAQAINLGFQPRFVIFGVAQNFVYNGMNGSDNNCMAIYPGVVCSGSTGWDPGSAQITATGFQAAGRSNFQGTTYHYAAIR